MRSKGEQIPLITEGRMSLLSVEYETGTQCTHAHAQLLKYCRV